MTTTLHNESQIVLSGKIDSRHDIVGRLGSYSVGAGPRRPSVDPAEGLGKPDFVPEEVGIFQLLEKMRAAGTRWRFQARSERRLHLDQPPPTSRLSRSQLGGPRLGHRGGRVRRAAPTARVGASTHDHIVGRNESAAAAACKKRLLFILIGRLDFTLPRQSVGLWALFSHFVY